MNGNHVREFVWITRTFGHEASVPQALLSSLLKSKLRHYHIR